MASFSLKQVSLKNIFLRHALSHKDLMLITRQLATLFKAGLPIAEVLHAVSEQTSQAQAKSILLSIKAKVLEGHALASALREHPQSFSPLYCSMVASGEKSGTLAAVLERLADYTEQQFKLKQKIIHALIYPSALICVSLCIVIFLLEYVVPKMISVYSQMHQALPTLTRILIAFSNNIKNMGLYLLVLLILGLWSFRAALHKKPAWREKFHHFLLRLPLLGSAIQTINTARFARTLAMLSTSGIPILEGMRSAAHLIINIPIRKAIEEATKRVREGAAIHLALKQTTYFSPMSIHLIASGEASGQLEALLERTALQQEDEITRMIDTLLTLFEPALILLMGGIVLFIVLAVLLPIFELNQIAL
ncbi:MAG TPA: type II secretion system inner membrane protein GspF, partial [Gammaproteobacteria bacterium]|nr:type II secretion system inner membrane protein GspF [Gammaproteobacteria bacterium]